MKLDMGQKIGDRYTLLQMIGWGGMADVWAADDAMLGRRVALKFLNERFSQDEQFVQRFRREAQAAAGLEHPNIVAVYDRGEENGLHWIAMEYVQGASLKDLIQRGLSVDEVVEIVRQILAAAKFAHERGIIHRDLKPHNVLVDSQGRARVTDFGIARAGPSEITQTGSVLGTAQYLSPEQAQGFEVDATSDLYSIGVILYEALTGQVPFDAETAVAIALKQVSEQPRPPSQVNPDVPPALDGVVLRALAKNPESRYQTADWFLAALEQAERDPTTIAQADTAAYAAAAALPAPGAVAAQTEPAYPVAKDSGRRNKLIALAAVALLIAAAAAYALTRPGQVRVPTVIGKSQDDATRILSDEGFDVIPTTFESCDEPRTVAEQDPPAGTEADEGSEVTISVSLGLSVSVPDVRGELAGDAANRLRRANLQVTDRPAFDDRVKAGRVIATRPAAGDSVECESLVTMLVSKGAKLVTLPDLIGRTDSDAQAELRRLGLVPDIDTENSDEPEGTVIGQDPGPGSSLKKNTVVVLIVSTGAGSIVVPNVEGQPREGAIDTLQGRGVTNVKVIEQETDDPREDDRVIDQAPAAGTRIRQGDQVTIFVAVFEEPAPPDDEQPFDPQEPQPRQPGGRP